MAAGPMTALSQGNSYIKDHASSGKLKVSFSRNPDEFSLPNYIQIRPVTKQRGLYLKIDQRHAARIVGGRIDDFLWHDGMDRPKPNNNGLEFQWLDFETKRRNINEAIGDLAREQADWDVEGEQEALQAHQAMTLRTKLVHDALDSSANWDAAHYKTVTTIPGVTSTWDASLSTDQFIRKSLNFATKRIKLSTLSKVKKKDLLLVMNPTTAYAIGQTQELIDVIKQSADAYGQVTQETGRWSEYGLPDRLYGLKVVVEDAVIVTSARGAATQTESFCMADGIAYVLSRPGGLVSRGGGPSFSTVTLFAKEEMTVLRTHDAYNKLMKIDVTDDVGVGLTAPVAGFALRGLLAS